MMVRDVMVLVRSVLEKEIELVCLILIFLIVKYFAEKEKI